MCSAPGPATGHFSAALPRERAGVALSHSAPELGHRPSVRRRRGGFAFVHADLGVRMIALRLAGFNPVDLAAACDAGIAMARVPASSPHAVAEPTVALIPALNRKTHRACKMRLEN